VPAARAAPERTGAPYSGRRPTINDIARLADVSKKTVSRVINESPAVRPETRAKVVSLIKQFGYMPDPQARGLAFRKSFLIGLVYDNPNAQYIVNIQEGALDALRGSGYELVVHPCDRKSADFIAGVRNFVERQKLRGAILLPPIAENPKLARALEELGCEYVRIASVQLDEHARMIVSNDRRAAAEAARYLESLGHKRIAIISGPDAYRSAHERREGFMSALEERGLKLAPNMVVEGGYTFESGVTCAEALLSLKPRPTAIFAANDEMAAGVYRVAYRLGLTIPGDLSVVGYDDSAVASRLWPSLTTIRLPIREMGRIAASKLLSESEGGPAAPPSPTIVEAHLVVRDSCQSPRQ
jgi:LacI family transcriptional regulator